MKHCKNILFYSPHSNLDLEVRWEGPYLLISGDMSSLSVWLESVSERDCGAEDSLDGG